MDVDAVATVDLAPWDADEALPFPEREEPDPIVEDPPKTSAFPIPSPPEASVRPSAIPSPMARRESSRSSCTTNSTSGAPPIALTRSQALMREAIGETIPDGSLVHRNRVSRSVYDAEEKVEKRRAQRDMYLKQLSSIQRKMSGTLLDKRTHSSAPPCQCSGYDGEHFTLWSSMNVSDWLLANGFEDVVGLFQRNKILGKHLEKLTEERLEKMGVAAMGDRMGLMESIEELVQKHGPAPQTRAAPRGGVPNPLRPGPMAPRPSRTSLMEPSGVMKRGIAARLASSRSSPSLKQSLIADMDGPPGSVRPQPPPAGRGSQPATRRPSGESFRTPPPSLQKGSHLAKQSSAPVFSRGLASCKSSPSLKNTLLTEAQPKPARGPAPKEGGAQPPRLGRLTLARKQSDFGGLKHKPSAKPPAKETEATPHPQHRPGVGSHAALARKGSSLHHSAVPSYMRSTTASTARDMPPTTQAAPASHGRERFARPQHPPPAGASRVRPATLRGTRPPPPLLHDSPMATPRRTSSQDSMASVGTPRRRGRAVTAGSTEPVTINRRKIKSRPTLAHTFDPPSPQPQANPNLSEDTNEDVAGGDVGREEVPCEAETHVEQKVQEEEASQQAPSVGEEIQAGEERDGEEGGSEGPATLPDESGIEKPSSDRPNPEDSRTPKVDSYKAHLLAEAEKRMEGMRKRLNTNERMELVESWKIGRRSIGREQGKKMVEQLIALKGSKKLSRDDSLVGLAAVGRYPDPDHSAPASLCESDDFEEPLVNLAPAARERSVSASETGSATNLLAPSQCSLTDVSRNSLEKALDVKLKAAMERRLEATKDVPAPPSKADSHLQLLENSIAAKMEEARRKMGTAPPILPETHDDDVLAL